MKKLVSVVVIGSVLVLVAAAVQAQLPGTPIRASIPFDFMVRGKMLPAGNYEVSRINDDPIGLMIRNLDQKHDTVMFETEPVYMRKTPGKNMLVFNRYGDTYFLSEIKTASENTAREAYPSRAERHLQQQTVMNHVEPQTVTVVCD
jgi:hypothetical protein